ncbi:MAG: hypothetical protein JSW07_21035 [bacterium]|nr:MAG: hypothetical protein JSW07_21035 [bacterium]
MIDKIWKVSLPWLLIFYFFYVDSSHSQVNDHKWLLKNRVHSGIDYDTNVEESRKERQSDGLVKFIWDSQAKHYNKTYLVNLQYHGGFQYYLKTPSEHKMTHDLSGVLVYQFSPAIRFGMRLWGRFKYFNRHDWHYFLNTSELFLSFNVLFLHSTIGYENEALTYLNYNKYNFNAHHVYLLFVKRFGDYFSTHLKTGYRDFDYQRKAVSPESTAENLLPLNKNQQDDNPYVSIQLSYQKGVLGIVEYQWQRNLSNSYGFSFVQHKLTLSLISSLSKGFLIRIYGSIRRKNYDEVLSRAFLTELDTEREISNFLILDCSKEISASLSLLIRLSFYDNESPIPGKYYQKTLASVSLEYRF